MSAAAAAACDLHQLLWIQPFGVGWGGVWGGRVPITVRGTAFNPVSSSLPIIHRLSAKCYEASISSNKRSKMGHAPSRGKNDKEQQQKKRLCPRVHFEKACLSPSQFVF